MPDEYLVSYTTKLDLLNNNFGSSTAIVTSEDDGIFSRSYTSEQINNWANERWKVPVNKTFTLAFRVIAEYAGGPTYEMPEVRTVEVTVTPIKVDVFDAERHPLFGCAAMQHDVLDFTHVVEYWISIYAVPGGRRGRSPLPAGIRY